MTNNTRSRDFTGGVAINGGDGERTSHSTLGWGGSIWNSNSNSIGFGSNARDSSRPRENSTYMSAGTDPIEGKTGSGSLVASSESDTWNLHRARWGDNTTAALPNARSSGVSPSRKQSVVQADPAQQYVDTTAAFFPMSRPSIVGQAPVAKPKPHLDPTSTNFTSSRRPEPLNASGFQAFGFGQVEAPQRSEASVGSWPDAASVHSPNDDRRSVTNSEYFGPSSATPSRSGSLPPSRHGNEPVQFNQNADYARFAAAGQRQHSSFSVANGRPYQERSGSIQSDSLHMIGRLSLEHDPDPGTMSHRPSVSVNGFTPTFSPSVQEVSLARENYGDAQTLSRRDDLGYTAGTYTPDSYANGYVNGHATDPNVQFRAFHFDSRSAPNGNTGARQSPHYSNVNTPPPFDHLYPSRTATEQTLSNGNNLALVHSKLHGYQLQQERHRNYMSPNQFHPQQQHLQHILAANQLRNAYNYTQFSVPNTMQLNGLPHNLAMPPMQPVIPLEPPRAPRDHTNASEANGALSNVLIQFKQASKTNKRVELKDIFGYVVEFSGDQHGSRFIQQKLESANSDEKDKVFKELQENCLQLMQDVFGNYVIQKFFEHGDQTQKKILANRMKGSIAQLATGMYGCRVVQKALEHVLTDQQAWMVKELEKDVLKCVKDANGNHVIQKVIERVPVEYIQNIIEAFRGQVGALALNGFGCRVIQRLLEKVPEPQRRFILTELHAEGSKLIADPYGNYVTQHVIEHGLPEDRAKIIALVNAQLLLFSKHKFASNVVEKCLLFGTDDQRRDIMLTVIAPNERGENSLPTLIKDGFGNYVIQKLLDTLSRRDFEELVAVLKPELEKTKKIISGKQITSVEKKMHRFDRVDSPSQTTATPSAQRSLLTSPTDSPPLPPLTSDAQSPQSSSLPSANTSTVDEPVHTSPSAANKGFISPPGVVGIENAS
ncbi:ARM repeat-containing protein [Lentithecium fluviatile CBS 122367]|uniref:ARM repeat-containing protein n=1 Tax=Lentithecium fluviatile CBS 122367 TaxID=1168545 RepID=A0A6G1JFD5_9PLEO|nr:ARM repeat-containing protein [Lentithecium fluviatile CBS 122367]